MRRGQQETLNEAIFSRLQEQQQLLQMLHKKQQFPA